MRHSVYKSYTVSESSCAALPDVAALPTLYVRTELAKIIGFSMADLINFILKHDFKQQYFENSTEVVGGIDGVLWLGCDTVDKFLLQVFKVFIFGDVIVAVVIIVLLL